VDTSDLNVTNANYERVIAVMEKFLTERYKDYCECSRCKCDIAAIALNYLPPHYIVETDVGTEHGSPWVMVETAVAEAIDRVMEHPNHPR
jgi:competence protein ComFB